MRTYSSRPIHTHPTGYHEGQAGPYKPARVRAWGRARRELTDRVTGEWRGARYTATVADSAHELKTALTAHATHGRGVLGRSYIVSIDGGRTGADPWPWYAGPLLGWNVDRTAQVVLEFGDQVGHVLGGLLSPDRKLPKRRVTLTDFPNAPQASLDLPVPIVYWTHRTNAGTNGLPLVYVGTRVMNDANTWHEWIVAGHAIHQFTFLNVNNVHVGGWGTSWAMPGQAGWATVTGSSAPYRDYNGRRYACVFGRGAQADSVAAATAKLQLECYGVELGGDGGGAPISAIGQQILHCWINWVLGDYQGGAWLPMPTYVTGWPQVDATAFAAIDATALLRIPGAVYPEGYYQGYTQTSLYFGVQHPGTAEGVVSDASRSIRESIGDIARSGDVRFGLNQYHQWTAVMLPDTVDVAALPLYGTTIPARILEETWATEAAFEAQWSSLVAVAGRQHVLVASPEVSVSGYNGTETYGDPATGFPGPTLELPFAAAYQVTVLGYQAEDIALRSLARHVVPVRTFTWETTRCGASKTDLGGIVGLSHYAYPDTRRIWVELMETGLETVRMSGWDITDLVPAGSP